MGLILSLGNVQQCLDTIYLSQLGVQVLLVSSGRVRGETQYPIMHRLTCRSQGDVPVAGCPTCQAALVWSSRIVSYSRASNICRTRPAVKPSISCWFGGDRPPKPGLWLCAVTSIPSHFAFSPSSQQRKVSFPDIPVSSLPAKLPWEQGLYAFL